LAASGRKRLPQIEQAYSPDHTLFPSRAIITARKQIFFSGMEKSLQRLRSDPEKEIQIFAQAPRSGALDFALHGA
jgi:hypothetical protein